MRELNGSHKLEIKNEVVDGQLAEDGGNLQSLDGNSLGAHASETQPVRHRSNREAASHQNTSFVTAASSDVNTAINQHFMEGQTTSTQEANAQPKVCGGSTESIAIDMLYGAELAEILKLYNIQRIHTSGIGEE